MSDNKNIEDNAFVCNRPKLDKRCFVSVAVDELIEKIKAEIEDDQVAWMFENCFPNTLDTTVDFEVIDGKPDTFVITGDINAMWLRDSTFQIWPYMSLINQDDQLKEMVKGLINRQVKCVLLDPYANAFHKDLQQISQWNSDQPTPKPGVHERKWEIDSLCSVVRLANEYYRLTNDISVMDEDFHQAMQTIVKVFKTEQHKNGKSPYWFRRKGCITHQSFDSTDRPVMPIGLISSMFRPSDDATVLPFLVPANLYAVQSLRQLAVLVDSVYSDISMTNECHELADEVEKAIVQHATFEHPTHGRMYAYEVDGFGSTLVMDDANVPSLMSLSYLGISEPSNELYQNTRELLICENNPFFIQGKAAAGQGSPHTGEENIWPIGITMRALTSNDDQEIIQCLSILKATHDGTGFMHESFHKDDASKYSRSWFAWANSLFSELIMKLCEERPHLLKQNIS